MPTVIRETSCARTCLARGRGACMCEPRSLLLLPLSKWPRMFRPLARWVSRILLSLSLLLSLPRARRSLSSPRFDPSLARPAHPNRFFTTHLFSGRDFKDSPLGNPFTSTQNQINALSFFFLAIVRPIEQ